MAAAGWDGYPPSGLGWPGAPAVLCRPAVPETSPPGRPGRAGQGARTPVEAGLAFRLGRAHRMLRGAWEKAIADLGVSPPQAALLRAAAQRPGCGLRELARLVGTDAMNAKRLADHLERAGLVFSAADPDHRQRRVLRLTGQGEGVARELAGRAAAQEARITALLGSRDVTALRALLERIERAVGGGGPR